MINKKNLWFLTLFSLILVLSVYYITMPSELLLTNGISYQETSDESTDEVVVNVEESEILTALRVDADEELFNELEALNLILTGSEASIDDKNNAFEKMKSLNINKGLETKIENLIKTELDLNTFVKINGDQVKVVVDNEEESTEMANKIMRIVQGNFDSKMYITVQFK
ncbi:MAG: SpoIIIAH-like family protein [Bacilli bacterium]